MRVPTACVAYGACIWTAWVASGVALAEQPDVAQGCEEVVKHISVARDFPPLGLGPPGCRYGMVSKSCLDESPVKAVRTSLRSSNHPAFSRVTSETIDPSDPKCAVVDYDVGVDHSGPEGRNCMQPGGFISFDVVLVPECSVGSGESR